MFPEVPEKRSMNHLEIWAHLRILNQSPSQSANLRPLAAFIWRNLPCILAIYSSHPTPSPTLLMHSLAQAAVDIHHAALSSLPQALRLPPRASVPSFPGVPPRFTSIYINLHDRLTAPC